MGRCTRSLLLLLHARGSHELQNNVHQLRETNFFFNRFQKTEELSETVLFFARLHDIDGPTLNDERYLSICLDKECRKVKLMEYNRISISMSVPPVDTNYHILHRYWLKFEGSV